MPSQSIISPVLIGRQDDLEQLTQLTNQAGGGAGQVVFLTGEAGIGKSRLVAETSRRAAERGFFMLQGSCFEHDSALPYAPLLDLLHSLKIGRAEDAALIVQPAAENLAQVLGELTTPVKRDSSFEAETLEQSRRRRYERLARIFVEMAAVQPILLVFEDLHWADDNTLEFLLLLARRLQSQPILLVLTYRSDEAPAALRQLLAELDRRHLALELALARLKPAEVDALVRAIFAQAQPVQADFIEPLYALTEGNPFFVEEVLKSLVTAGEIFFGPAGWTRKPLSELSGLRVRSLQETVERRAQLLSPAAQDLLTLAAVAGRRFDFLLLQYLTCQTEDALLTLIQELIAAQLVVEVSADQFAFRHALTRQTIYTGLLARERRARHAQISAILETVYAGRLDTHLPDLAHHAFEGGLWEKALAHAEAAGDQALALYAPRAAVDHYTQALQAAKASGRAPHPALWRARARAQQMIGVFEPVRDNLAAALAGAKAAGDRRLEWELLIDLGLLWTSRDYAQTEAYLRRAFELAQTLNDPAALGHSLNRLGNYLTNVERPQEALAYQQQALGLFEALDDRPGLAEAHDLTATTLVAMGDWVRGAAHHQQALSLFRELDQRQGAASSLTMSAMRAGAYLNDTTVTLAAEAGGWQDAEAALSLARQTGQRAAEALAASVLAFCLGPRGEYTRALALAEAGLAAAQEIEHQHWITFGHLAHGALYLDLMAGPEAEAHLTQALALAREIGSRFFETMAAAFLVSTHVQQNNLAGAEAVFEAAAIPALPARSGMQRQAWAARAELALVQGDARRALQISEQLLATALNLEAENGIPRLAWLRGRALAALGKQAPAVAALTAAEEAARQHGWPSVQWRILASLARAHQALGQRQLAQEAAGAARGMIAELAAQVANAALRQTFEQQAAAELPSPTRPSARQQAKDEFGGLTWRERDVAALVAQGKSNRAIASELVLSERTVAKHVENILSKLSFDSRAQIAVWAAARRLAPPAPPANT